MEQNTDKSNDSSDSAGWPDSRSAASKPQFSEKELALLERLRTKYAASGQDLESYLEGLYFADFLDYWDYIHLETLLSLQTPRTNLPDEQVFIIYHQITELYFKLIRSELSQIADDEGLTAAVFSKRLVRINRYTEALINSFEIMVEGMDREQFMNFRMSLLPASGFQSVQFRLIEIESTDFSQLLGRAASSIADTDVAALYPHLYWLEGATELATGVQTLTLRRFDQKYRPLMLREGAAWQQKNLRYRYTKVPGSPEEQATLHGLLRRYDELMNINWRLAHYKSAVKYLQRSPENIAATGGTNWQKYLPPRFQKRMFYPELHSPSETENWGRSWVEDTLNGLR